MKRETTFLVHVRVARLSEDRVCRDQRNVETITSINRPSDVQAKCKEFYSGERMDALEIIEKECHKTLFPDQRAIGIQDSRIASIIFEVGDCDIPCCMPQST